MLNICFESSLNAKKVNLEVILKDKQLIIPIIVASIMFMEFLDATILNTAIPSIAKDFVISPVVLKFAVASYYLSLAIFIPISGWCADRFGTKRMFMLSIALFLIASVLCAVAQNMMQLTLFRFMQGIGGAFMNPVSRIIIVRLFPPKELLRVQGIIFTPAMLGYILGPVVGGVLTTYLSWHWIFYINIPFGIFALYGGYKFIEQQISNKIEKFDLFGFIIAALSLCLITIFIETLNHYEILSAGASWMCGVLGIILFLLLIVYCLRKVDPVFDFSLFRIRTFRVGCIVNLSTYGINASIGFLLPLMYQECFHYSPLKSGMMVLPIAIGYISGRSFASHIIRYTGFRTSLRIWSIFITVCIFLLGFISKNTSIYYIILVEFLLGIATTIIGSTLGALNYVDISKENSAKATAIDLTFRQFSSSFGIGVTAFCLTTFAQIFNLTLFSTENTVFHLTFYTLAIIALVGLFNSLKLDKNDGAHALLKS